MMKISTFSLGVTRSHNKDNIKLPHCNNILNYSWTWPLQWPPSGTEESGSYKEVAVVKRFNEWIICLPGRMSGHYREVAVVESWKLVEVWLYQIWNYNFFTTLISSVRRQCRPLSPGNSLLWMWKPFFSPVILKNIDILISKCLTNNIPLILNKWFSPIFRLKVI